MLDNMPMLDTFIDGGYSSSHNSSRQPYRQQLVNIVNKKLGKFMKGDKRTRSDNGNMYDTDNATGMINATSSSDPSDEYYF